MGYILVTKNIVLNIIEDNTCSLGIKENVFWRFLVVEYLVFFHSLFVKGFLMIFNKAHSKKRFNTELGIEYQSKNLA